MRLRLTVFALLASCSQAVAPVPSWRIQYFFDKDQSTFEIHDIRFMSPERGIAVGAIVKVGHKPVPVSVITRDGGTTWSQMALPELPVSVFFLNDSDGWLVTEKGLYATSESGRAWKRLRAIKGARRVHFLDRDHGFMTGAPKLFEETKDGGKTWSPVGGLDQVQGAPEHTYFDWIEWVNPKQAIVLGANIAPRRDRATWMDPGDLARQREWPGLNITLETNDGGATWKPSTAPTFGRFARFRRSPEYPVSLILVRFVNAFQYPSEVYLADAAGKTTRVFREQTRNVTDLLWSGKVAYLAAVEPVGKLHQLPVPGRVHVLSSGDARTWTEMNVDYRANAQNIVMAGAGNDVWMATDTGMILKLNR